MEIWSLIIPYAKNKARNVRNLEKQLESHIDLLENKINTNPDDGTDAEQQEFLDSINASNDKNEFSISQPQRGDYKRLIKLATHHTS